MFFEGPRKASRDLRFPIQDFIQKRPDCKFDISLHGGNKIINLLVRLRVMPRVCKPLDFHGIAEDSGVFWDVMLRCRISFFRCFEGFYCRHLHGLWVPGRMPNVGCLLLRFWKVMGKRRASQRSWLKMKTLHSVETSGNTKLAKQYHTPDNL